MSEEEKQIMNKMIYYNLVNGEQALKFNRHIKQIQEENEQLHSIIKEVRQDLINTKILNTHIKDKYNNEYIYIDIDHIEYLIKALDKVGDKE